LLIQFASEFAVGAKTMDTGHLQQLAEQLKVDKNPACRRAINRILAEVKERWEKGEYDNPLEAESAFRRSVENQTACKQARTPSGTSG
jgi:hypothetical protein